MGVVLAYILIGGFLCGFAALFIGAMFPRGRLWAGYRRVEADEQSILEQRSGLGGMLVGLALASVGVVAGYALVNTALMAGWGWHWLLWLPLIAMFGANLVWLGLFFMAGRFRVVIDRQASTWRSTSYLGPLPFWTRQCALSDFHAIRVDARRGTKTGWHWRVSLLRDGDLLEIGGGDEELAYRLAADLQTATGLPHLAGPETRTPPAVAPRFVELVRNEREVVYRGRAADRVAAILMALFAAGFIAATGSSLVEGIRGFGWPPAAGAWFEGFLLGFNLLAFLFGLYLLKSALTSVSVQADLQFDRQTHTLDRRYKRLLGGGLRQTIQAGDVQEISLEQNDQREWAAVLVGRDGARWTIDHALDEQPIRQLALDAAETLGVACNVVESKQVSTR
jgi:hypothetical protein